MVVKNKRRLLIIRASSQQVAWQVGNKNQALQEETERDLFLESAWPIMLKLLKEFLLYVLRERASGRITGLVQVGLQTDQRPFTYVRSTGGLVKF